MKKLGALTVVLMLAGVGVLVAASCFWMRASARRDAAVSEVADSVHRAAAVAGPSDVHRLYGACAPSLQAAVGEARFVAAFTAFKRQHGRARGMLESFHQVRALDPRVHGVGPEHAWDYALEYAEGRVPIELDLAWIGDALRPTRIALRTAQSPLELPPVTATAPAAPVPIGGGGR